MNTPIDGSSKSQQMDTSFTKNATASYQNFKTRISGKSFRTPMQVCNQIRQHQSKSTKSESVQKSEETTQKFVDPDTGFQYKQQKYHQSCFPCALQVVMSNICGNTISDQLEIQWDQMQKNNGLPSLEDNAPNEEQVHSNLVGSELPGIDSYRIITPTLLKAADDKYNEEVKNFFSDDGGFKGMVIGMAHAHAICKQGDEYVFFKPSSNPNYIEVERADTISVECMKDDEGAVIVVKGEKNGIPTFGITGEFIMLVR